MARWFALESADGAYFDTAPHVFHYTKHYTTGTGVGVTGVGRVNIGVGSGGQNGDLDIAATVGAERLREIMTDLVNRAAGVVQRYGGTVDSFTARFGLAATSPKQVLGVVAAVIALVPKRNFNFSVGTG
jgi:hypothetical protein